MRSAPPPPPPGGAAAGREPAPRSVAGRVLSVLDAFAGERRRLTLSDISRRTGMPLATTHRLVGELLSWGALERDRNGRYEIGLHLWAVAAMAPRWLELRDVAMPFLLGLYRKTGRQQVRLAVLDGMETVLVERIGAPDTGATGEPVGGRRPAHATGDGLVLLAYAGATVQERYLVHHAPATGLRRVLAEVEGTGCAVNGRWPGPGGTVSAAAPVRDATGEVVAAVSVVPGTSGAGQSALAPVVMATGRTISRALFHRQNGA
ncbi:MULTISPECIES: IclR family transcriptional regulator [Streptomyces violaceusniger group]|uniref:IclR family transcriptional regulator n=2 Tax=Streptomyces javensis TaxID=114698 RepID=A0ABS0RJ25_9ACTN|nr:IclR family transcriptional regulator [Streptomyces javensis]MBI0317435.1 IclR family transcriptional regulator [Streptomyces javensis]